MKPQEFFNSYQIKKKFSFEDRNRVQWFMRKRGYLEDFSAIEAAAAIIFLSCTCTESDLENFSDSLLTAETKYRESEPLLEVLRYILNDPLNAACIENLAFDRIAGRVHLELVDGSQIEAVNLPVPITPDWKQPGGITFTKTELVHIATDLEDYEAGGELVEDMDEYLKQFNEN